MLFYGSLITTHTVLPVYALVSWLYILYRAQICFFQSGALVLAICYILEQTPTYTLLNFGT